MTLARYSYEATDATCDIYNFTAKYLVSLSVARIKHLLWHNYIDATFWMFLASCFLCVYVFVLLLDDVDCRVCIFNRAALCVS